METTGPCAPQHGEEAPSPWIRRWSHLLQPGGTVLDVACGAGRHTRWFNQRGHPVTGVDRSAAALCALDDIGTQVERIEADIENAPWPLMQQGRPRDFNAVVVTNYLWRPLWPVLLQSVAPGGVLLYETFAEGHEALGRPTNPAFLLRQDELLDVARGGLSIVAFEQGRLAGERPAIVQRLAAIRPGRDEVPRLLP